MAFVVLDIGHIGRTGGNRPGSHGDLREDICSVRYGAAAFEYLTRAGVEVGIAGVDGYGDRQAWASKVADLYVCLHTNGGGGTYGLVLSDYRSTGGLKAAQAIGKSLEAAWCPGVLSKVRIEPAKPEAADGSRHWTANAFGLVRGVYAGKPCGVVVEPGFLDQAAHASMWTPEGLERTGRALAEGILAWLKERA